MRIHASLRPPNEVIAHLEEALRPEQARQPEQVAWLDKSHIRLHLANFGNLTHKDALRLSEVMAKHVKALPPPTLRFSGLIPLPEEGDDSIWVGIDGDLEAIKELAASIHPLVWDLGFVLDRRGSYRPRVRVGRITDQTTLAGIERLVQHLGAYAGPQWTADALTLGSERPIAPGWAPGFDVFHQVHFAGVNLHRAK